MANELDDPKGALNLRYYQAYGTDEKRQERLGILPVASDWYELPYDYLLNMVSDGCSWTWIELWYSSERFPRSSSLTVKIVGRNLQPLWEVLMKRECTFIQEYHPNRFFLPDPDELVITRIEVVVNRKDELLVGQGTARH